MKPAAIVVAVALVVAGIALAGNRGSTVVFIAFNLCFVALGVSILPRPRLYAYSFLSAFLLLGFWLKVMFHAIFAPGFIEPVGDFADVPAEWDAALLAASSAALGLIAVRLAHLWCTRRRQAAESGAAAPGWFARWRRTIWALTIVAVIGVNAANLQFAFYQIGVKPKLLLPLHGHVLLSWLVNIGFALWVAALVWWDAQHTRRLGRNLVAPLGESLLSATSAFSRMNFILHAVPYALAMFERRKDLAGFLAGRWRRAAGLALVLFLCSIVAVFWLREARYYKPADRNPLHTMTTQVPLLLVHRWIGLEGVLAVGAGSDRGTQTFLTALAENPKLGDRSLFQRIAKANVRYAIESEHLVFLSNAGPVAVLWFSGSLAIVFAGMAFIGAVLVLTEEAARRLTGNPFLLAVAGAALANVVAQTTFFYLTLVFLLQLWVAIAFLAALQRLDFGNSLKG